MDTLIHTLHRLGCSLVLRDAAGHTHTFNKQGVRDLEHLLDHEPQTLRGAWIADKVVGKAAAALMAVGGVSRVHADVMSRKALPLLRDNGIEWSCGELVDAIVIPLGDDRCPLEQIVEQAATAPEAVEMLRAHFAEMQRKRRADNAGT